MFAGGRLNWTLDDSGWRKKGRDRRWGFRWSGYVWYWSPLDFVLQKNMSDMSPELAERLRDDARSLQQQSGLG